MQPVYSPIEALSRPGVERFLGIVPAANPAAGAEIIEVVPAGQLWHVHSVRAVLVTDATVANRQSILTLDDGTNPFLELASQSNQAASTTVRYSWAQVYVAQYTSTQRSILPFPVGGIILQPGWRVTTSTPNLQANDNYARPQIFATVYELRSLAGAVREQRREDEYEATIPAR